MELPKGYVKSVIQIGVPNTDERAVKVGLKSIGDMVLPSADYGPICKKNAYGYSYSDKTKQKEERYVSTVWIKPYGNEHASPVASDIYRKCYPKINVPPTDIELVLYENDNNETYIIADLTTEIRDNYLKDAINLFLEIFHECYVFSDEIRIDAKTKRRKCNWEILPPGEKPSTHLYEQLRDGGKTDSFDLVRLQTLDKYLVEQIVEGINGFAGYYAYVFKKHCVLESAKYGNATYIIPKKNWETYSQMTKKELFDDKIVIDKLIHNENWQLNIAQVINKLENQ
ncbi:MAG: hypothetical protein IJK58_09065 [Clostridia bacterium]|nr:hypothetical protein [Clostridia bacterium]